MITMAHWLKLFYVLHSRKARLTPSESIHPLIPLLCGLGSKIHDLTIVTNLQVTGEEERERGEGERGGKRGKERVG